MVEETSNDNEMAMVGTASRSPDPHGQAAMLLVESLLHGLVARSALTTADALDIVATAAEVKVEVAADLGDTPAAMRKSLALLESIAISLGADLPKD